jgi:hypothetical protein
MTNLTFQVKANLTPKEIAAMQNNPAQVLAQHGVKVTKAIAQGFKDEMRVAQQLGLVPPEKKPHAKSSIQSGLNLIG